MAAIWLALSAAFAAYWNDEFASAETAVPAFMTTLLLAGIGWLLLYLRARVFNRGSAPASRARPRG